MKYDQNSSNTYKGEALVVVTAFFAALLPVISHPNLTKLPPLWIAAFSTAIASVVFLIICFLRGKLPELKNIEGRKNALIGGSIIGALFYGLVHVGSFFTSPQNASIILSLEVLVSILILHKFKDEKLNKLEVAGAVLLLLALAIIFLPQTSTISFGDLILLFACTLTPIGNLFIKKARRSIGGFSIMLIRSLIASLLLIVFALIINGPPNLELVKSAYPLLLINGIIILGLSKVCWVEAINLIPIPKACAIGSVAPLFTYLLAWLIHGSTPTLSQLLALPIAVLGIWLSFQKPRTSRSAKSLQQF